jgi:hypothetical protein
MWAATDAVMDGGRPSRAAGGRAVFFGEGPDAVDERGREGDSRNGRMGPVGGGVGHRFGGVGGRQRGRVGQVDVSRGGV